MICERCLRNCKYNSKVYLLDLKKLLIISARYIDFMAGQVSITGLGGIAGIDGYNVLIHTILL